MIEKALTIPYDRLIQTLCCQPFYKHSRCPNFNYKQGCPPGPLIDEIFDLSRDVYVIYTMFNVGEFAERMRISHKEWKQNTYNNEQGSSNRIIDSLHKKHPEWPESYYPATAQEEWASSRQWYNPRLWQPAARKEHRQELEKICGLIESSPESRGVNITGVMAELGIKLNWQWPPEHNIDNVTYLVSLAGTAYHQSGMSNFPKNS
jgi:hypothetical protein